MFCKKEFQELNMVCTLKFVVSFVKHTKILMYL